MKPINLNLLALILFLCAFSSLNAQYYGYSKVELQKFNGSEWNATVLYISSVCERATRTELKEVLTNFETEYLNKLSHYDKKKNMYTSSYSSIYTEKDEATEWREKNIKGYKRKHCEINYIEMAEKSFDSEAQKELAFFNNIDIDGMKVSGSFTLKAKFVFMGYPYIVAEYDDLTITDIKYKNKNYSQTLNSADKYLSLPYKAKSKPSMDVVCYVWTPIVESPKHLKKEHYKIFNYPINGLASITDHYDNDEADQHFKSFDYDDEHDSFFWIRSLLRNPRQDVMGDLETIKVTSISLTLKQELEKKLKTYLYEKDRDFWGNKKNKTKNTKKTKKDDDFWN